MSNKRHTCDKCNHYTPSTLTSSDKFKHAGDCVKAGDSIDGPTPIDGITGYDYEGYSAGVYVGPKFGCIHWEKKA